MNRYYATECGVVHDHLVAGTVETLLVRAVNTAEDAVLERGQLVAGTGVGTDLTVAPATAADIDKPLFIVRDDFVADADHTVAVVYSSGLFNRSEIKVTGASIDDFEEALRRVNILLTDYIPSRGGD